MAGVIDFGKKHVCAGVLLVAGGLGIVSLFAPSSAERATEEARENSIKATQMRGLLPAARDYLQGAAYANPSIRITTDREDWKLTYIFSKASMDNRTCVQASLKHGENLKTGQTYIISGDDYFGQKLLRVAARSALTPLCALR